MSAFRGHPDPAYVAYLREKEAAEHRQRQLERKRAYEAGNPLPLDYYEALALREREERYRF